MDQPPLQDFVEKLVAGGGASAAVALVATAAEKEFEIQATAAAGARVASRFDLASLTKPFVATLACALHRRGLLPLDLPLAEVWPRRPLHPRLRRRALADLLRHRAGFQPWAPLYHLCSDVADVSALLLAGGYLLGARAGTYSDLGYILWGLAAEERLGEPLEALLARWVLEPLHLTAVEAVRAEPGSCSDIVPCALDTDKEVELAAARGLALAPLGPPPPGVPQDGNARFFAAAGRLAGHAGLFGGAGHLARLGREWLRPRAVLDAATVARALAGTGAYALGWARRRTRGSAGPALSPTAFGHVGFTGGSLWLDPRSPGREGIYVLLSHRRSAASDFNRHRRRFHRLAVASSA